MDTTPVTFGTKKTLAGSATKSSLTPCRRLGLSRPSSSSLHKSYYTKTICTPNTTVQEAFANKSISVLDRTPKLNCDETRKVPLKLSDAQNKHGAVRKVRRCLTSLTKTPVKFEGETRDLIEIVSVQNSSQNCKKVKLSLEQISGNKKVGQCTNLDNSSSLVHKTDNTGSAIHILTANLEEEDGSTEEVTPEAVEKLVKSIQEKKKKLEQLKVQEVYAKKHELEELRAQTAKWKKAGRETLEYSVNLAKRAGYSVTIKELMSQHSFPQHLMGYNSEDDEFE